MPTAAERRLARRAVTVLTADRSTVRAVDDKQAGHPGLYAIYGSAQTWRELGLGSPPDGRPLYIGKAEDTLAARDLRGHFGLTERRGKQSITGSSTVRRSLAALLAPAERYRGRPRNPENPGHFSNFGLSPAQDERLSAWMARRLRIALWPHNAPGVLDRVETLVLLELEPPLNLTKITTRWTAQVKAARKLLAGQAERAARPRK